MPKKRLVKPSDGSWEYEGELSANVPHGFGRAKFKNGSEYRGTWLDGQVRVLHLPHAVAFHASFSTSTVPLSRRAFKSNLVQIN